MLWNILYALLYTLSTTVLETNRELIETRIGLQVPTPTAAAIILASSIIFLSPRPQSWQHLQTLSLLAGIETYVPGASFLWRMCVVPLGTSERAVAHFTLYTALLIVRALLAPLLQGTMWLALLIAFSAIIRERTSQIDFAQITEPVTAT